jgi:glycolate oxidase iron-sulfur subunit
MCQAVCPVFKTTGFEADVARGKVALLDGLTRQILTQPDQVLERLNRCLLCGACERRCSRKVDLMAIFLTARIIITGYCGLPIYKKLIFRVFLIRPTLFDSVIRTLARIQGLFLKKDNTGRGMHKVRWAIPFFKGRFVPPISGEAFRAPLEGIHLFPPKHE